MGDLVERLKGVAIQEAKTFGGDVEERTEWKAATRISSLEEENRRLREAPRPFGELASKIDPYRKDDDRAMLYWEAPLIGNLRRAREAIGEKNEKAPVISDGGPTGWSETNLS